MTNIVSKVKSSIDSTVDGITMGYVNGMTRLQTSSLLHRKTERGDIVQTIIIIALFVGVTILVANLLFPAIKGAAENTGCTIANAGDASSAAAGGAGTKC